jgi:hypothetical protein
MGQVGLLLDVVVAALLVATIVYATVLNRKLTLLRDNKQEMEALVNRLVESTEHAERGLADLKAAAGEKGDELERRVKEARALADDLGFLVDKGGGLADRLEQQIGQARSAGGRSAPATPEPAAPAPRASAESWPGARAVKHGASDQGAGTPAAGAGAQRPGRRGAAQAAAAEPARAAAAEPLGDGDPRNNKLLKALRGVR